MFCASLESDYLLRPIEGGGGTIFKEVWFLGVNFENA